MKQIDPLEFLRAVYLNGELPLSVRMRAAIELLPFTHPKLAVTALVNEQSFAELLDRRLKRIEEMNGKAKAINGPIDQSHSHAHTSQVPITAEVKPAIDAPKPMPRTVDRRFRRM
jgi:hypothetical protein